MCEIQYDSQNDVKNKVIFSYINNAKVPHKYINLLVDFEKKTRGRIPIKISDSLKIGMRGKNKQKRILYEFLLDDGRKVVADGPDERSAASMIPIRFGNKVKWATGTSKKPGEGKKYTF